MTHDELLAYINKEIDQAAWTTEYYPFKPLQALRAVVELHKPDEFNHCGVCNQYLCETIQAIEKELTPLSKSQVRRITKVKSDELQEKELK